MRKEENISAIKVERKRRGVGGGRGGGEKETEEDIVI